MNLNKVVIQAAFQVYKLLHQQHLTIANFPPFMVKLETTQNSFIFTEVHGNHCAFNVKHIQMVN